MMLLEGLNNFLVEKSKDNLLLFINFAAENET